MVNEAPILAHVMDKSRRMSMIYLDLLKDTDLYRIFSVDGKPVNNIFWLIAHLAVTENFLLLRTTGGEPVKIPWARQFGLGSVVPPKEECPPLDEVQSIFAEVHQKSLAHVRTIPDEKLPEINPTGFVFDGENSIRSMIIHAIRHESGHAGHLSWLCKFHGIKTL